MPASRWRILLTAYKCVQMTDPSNPNASLSQHEAAEARRQQIAEAAEQYLDGCIAEVINDLGYEGAFLEALVNASGPLRYIIMQSLCGGEVITLGNIIMDMVREHVSAEANRRALEMAEREYED